MLIFAIDDLFLQIYLPSMKEPAERHKRFKTRNQIFI